MAKELSIRIIIPNSINVVGLVHQNIVANLLRKQSSNIELPSAYKRAFMVAREVGELYATDDIPAED